jgi:hypothetical protein
MQLNYHIRDLLFYFIIDEKNRTLFIPVRILLPIFFVPFLSHPFFLLSKSEFNFQFGILLGGASHKKKIYAILIQMI